MGYFEMNSFKDEFLQTLVDFKLDEKHPVDLSSYLDKPLLMFNKRDVFIYVEPNDANISIFCYKFVVEDENLQYCND